MFHLPHWLLHRTKYRFQDQVNLMPFAYLWTMRRTAPVGKYCLPMTMWWQCNIQYCGLVLISSWYRLHIHMQLSQLFFLNWDSACYEFTALCYRQIHRNGPQKHCTSVEDVFVLCRYKARLPMMQSEETIWFQSLLFQSLSESKRWIEVILHDKRKHVC